MSFDGVFMVFNSWNVAHIRLRGQFGGSRQGVAAGFRV